MALSQNSANNASRWSVMWLGKRGIVEKKFDTDFTGALEFYVKVVQADKKLATLRSCNVGFPPPDHITQHEYYTYRVVKRKGKRFRKRIVHHKDLMPEYNERGIYWCPYCIKLRPFKLVKDWVGRQHMTCPVCKITERDFNIRQWNPKAVVIDISRRKRGRRRNRAVRRRSR